eukprot:3858699-Pleurochrysis_carterae.AAC.5
MPRSWSAPASNQRRQARFQAVRKRLAQNGLAHIIRTHDLKRARTGPCRLACGPVHLHFC